MGDIRGGSCERCLEEARADGVSAGEQDGGYASVMKKQMGTF